MTGHHMAGHLEVVAGLCREGNPAGMAAARSMLADRQMLVALEAVDAAYSNLTEGKSPETAGLLRDEMRTAWFKVRAALAALDAAPAEGETVGWAALDKDGYLVSLIVENTPRMAAGLSPRAKRIVRLVEVPDQ